MARYRQVLAVVVIFFCTTANSCTQEPLSKSCGSFYLGDRKTDTNSTGQAALFELTFIHDAKMCKVSCGHYWFVQALRPLDMDKGEIIQPLDTQQDRRVTGQSDEFLNGWAIDREEGRKLGWYHVTDDFKLEPASGFPGEMFQLGNGITPAMMHDTIQRGDKWAGKRMQIVGLTAAIGLDPGTACYNKIIGLGKWMAVFGHDDSRNLDTVDAPVELQASEKDVQAFLGAVDEWNKHLDDGRVRLPWADAGSAFTLP